MNIYEVQLGRIEDGAKNGDIDYDSPQLVLIESNHYPKIEEVEVTYAKEIESLGCDCVYGITELEEWELKEYQYYEAIPKFKIMEKIL